ncbi:hypothetical protein CFC21_106533 [Triticum aestivum]|uniref:Uncharacterized protein n=2 Tax=Triticum aestivum TaxID=4565 RepID=A0A9R1MEG6_WHEAT|nr:hypothetical protein CFC21_106533 [Triticum aestivum]
MAHIAAFLLVALLSLDVHLAQSASCRSCPPTKPSQPPPCKHKSSPSSIPCAPPSQTPMPSPTPTLTPVTPTPAPTPTVLSYLSVPILKFMTITRIVWIFSK